MMKKTIYTTLITLLSLNYAIAGTQVVDKTIKDIAMGWGGEGVYIQVNEAVTPVEGCTGTTFIITPHAPLFEANMSVILSAFHTNSKVRFYVEGCFADNMLLKAVAISK